MIKIQHKNTLLGIKINSISNGSNPVTEDGEFIQIVTLKHPSGTYLKAHKHAPTKRVTQKLQECLVVVKGEVKLDLYDIDDNLVKNVLLHEGQAYISINGGIGVRMMKDSEIIEVKNGPFIEDKVLI